MKEFNFILLGWALAMTLLCFYLGKLLKDKPTTENHIEKLKQKNKRNNDSNIDNDISADITTNNQDIPSKKRKERKLKGLFKRKNK
jgi:hypothetical protein